MFPGHMSGDFGGRGGGGQVKMCVPVCLANGNLTIQSFVTYGCFWVQLGVLF